MIMDTPKIKPDPLSFKDSKKYIDRLKVAQKKNQTNDSVIVASGTISGKKIVCAVFDFNFMGGSMGMAAGEAIVTACEFAKKELLTSYYFQFLWWSENARRNFVINANAKNCYCN